MGRRRLQHIPRVGVRLLVALALLRPPPGDFLGGWGRGDRARYIYVCDTCEHELPPEDEAAQEDDEPYCPIDRAHGRTRFLRQV